MTYPHYDHGDQSGDYTRFDPQYPAYGYPPQYGHGYGYGPTPSERSDAATANYLGLLCLVGAGFAWLGPLIYRTNQGQHSAFVRESATAALNFHLSMLIYSVGGTVVACVLGVALAFATHGIGMMMVLVMVPIVLGIGIWEVVASCIGGSQANQGIVYPYPGAIRMFK